MNNIKAFIYKDMKRNATFKVLLMFIVGLFLSVNTFAQQIVVKGIVKDTTGEPIIGANVIVKGTTNGTITDFDGNFLLNANKGDIIIISFIGYRSQEAQAAASMNIILKDDTELLDEVVVIGYGSVKKDDLSGSVVAIKAEEMNKGAVTSPQELIMGKVPGLSVSQGDGAPGAGSTIRIRGGASLNASNDPLIVIDGLKISDVNTQQLTFTSQDDMVFRFQVDEPSQNIGGLTLFGKDFGNYNQDINVKVHYTPNV